MHLPQAIRYHLASRSRSPEDGQRANRSSRQGCPFGCFDCIAGQRLHVWCPMAVLICLSVVCIGMFEAMRLSTHVLSSPCTIVRTEMTDVGTCTLCDNLVPSTCQIHPITSARLFVTFKHRHLGENITGTVWYCKNRMSEDPCLPQLGFLDQFALDLKSQRARQPPGGPVPCTTADVLSHLQEQMLQADKATCYYSSRDERGEDVWLSIPSPGLVDHAWFQSHLEYPVLMALGSLVLLTLLLGCLAVEGAELYFSGIV